MTSSPSPSENPYIRSLFGARIEQTLAIAPLESAIIEAMPNGEGLSQGELCIQRKMTQLLRYEEDFLGMWVTVEQMCDRIRSSGLRGVTPVQVLGVAHMASKHGGVKRFTAMEDEDGWWIKLDTGSEQEHAARSEERGKKRRRQ